MMESIPSTLGKRIGVPDGDVVLQSNRLQDWPVLFVESTEAALVGPLPRSAVLDFILQACKD